MKRLYWSILIFLSSTTYALAQPYLDIAAVKYQYSPDAGAFRQGKQPNHFTYGSAGFNLPHVFKDSSVLVLSPLVEKWEISSPALPYTPFVVKGITAQLAFIKPLRNHWTLTSVLIPRWNSENFSFKTRWLPAGAILVSRKLSPQFTYKFGLFVHQELYGIGFMPLAGLEWKINSSTQVFGILPGSLVLEKKASRFFYYGASFRAITTSYLYQANRSPAEAVDKFLRIDENQVQAYADCYLTKNIVLNAEAGHSVLRRLRTGTVNNHRKYEMKEKFNDDVLFRIAVLYRVRFD